MDVPARAAYWLCYAGDVRGPRSRWFGLSVLPAWNPAAVLFCALLFSKRKINPGAAGEWAPVCPSAFIKDLKAEASVFLPVEGRSRIKVPSSSGNSESPLTGSTIKGGWAHR